MSQITDVEDWLKSRRRETPTQEPTGSRATPTPPLLPDYRRRPLQLRGPNDPRQV